MRVIRVHEFGTPEVMKLEEMPDPKAGPGQVLVRVKAIGVNPVDTYIRSGSYGTRKLPYTPGTDAGGVVEAVGEGVAKFKPGDRVYTSGAVTGAYAELTLCKESQTHPLPEQISFSQGASVGVPYAAAYRAMFQRACAAPGETVLIHGATGGVGIAAVQLARSRGLNIIATGGTARGRELAEAHGAHHVIDHRPPEHFQKILDLTGGAGVDVIIEMLSNVNLGEDLKILARGGRVAVVGCRGTVEIDPRETMGREAAVLGMSLFNATDKEMAGIHAAIGAGLENGTLRPVIGQEMPLNDAPRAHHVILESNAYGKIILVP